MSKNSAPEFFNLDEYSRLTYYPEMRVYLSGSQLDPANWEVYHAWLVDQGLARPLVSVVESHPQKFDSSLLAPVIEEDW